MKKFQTAKADLFISDDMERTLQIGRSGYSKAELDVMIWGTLNCFFNTRPEFREYCELYAKKLGVKPYAILDAHGIVSGNCWIYLDGCRRMPLQNWIGRQDGNYGTLLIECCNDEGSKYQIPHSKKSLLMFANGLCCPGLAQFGSGNFNFELRHPKEGIISTYEIEYFLKQLKAG